MAFWLVPTGLQIELVVEWTDSEVAELYRADATSVTVHTTHKVHHNGKGEVIFT